MRAGDIFKYAHMALFISSLGMGVLALKPAQAQDFEVPGDEEEEEYYDGEEEEYYDEERESPREVEKERDNPTEDRIARRSRLVVLSDREAYGIPFTRRISPPTTDAISNAISNTYGFCAQIEDQRYLVDCIAERLLSIARSLPKTGDYDEARAILVEAATEMRELVVANKAPTAPQIRVTGKLGGKTVRTRPLTAVRKERVKQVNQQAAAILQEAETKLLRSAQASDRRLIAYAKIAQAVGSNKKLLRSA